METKELITLSEQLNLLAYKASTAPAKMTCRDSQQLGEMAMSLVKELWDINNKEEIEASNAEQTKLSDEPEDTYSEDLLEALEQGGVGNWAGYGFAIESWEARAGCELGGCSDEIIEGGE